MFKCCKSAEIIESGTFTPKLEAPVSDDGTVDSDIEEEVFVPEVAKITETVQDDTAERAAYNCCGMGMGRDDESEEASQKSSYGMCSITKLLAIG